MKRNIGAILFSVILISVITFPFLWLLLGSFKTMKELFSVPIRFFPEHISLDNYIAVFKAQPFGLYLYNSIVIAHCLIDGIQKCNRGQQGDCQHKDQYQFFAFDRNSRQRIACHSRGNNNQYGA